MMVEADLLKLFFEGLRVAQAQTKPKHKPPQTLGWGPTTSLNSKLGMFPPLQTVLNRASLKGTILPMKDC